MESLVKLLMERYGLTRDIATNYAQAIQGSTTAGNLALGSAMQTTPDAQRMRYAATDRTVSKAQGDAMSKYMGPGTASAFSLVMDGRASKPADPPVDAVSSAARLLPGTENTMGGLFSPGK